MLLSDFDYILPEDLIAQEPPVERDGARMLVLDRATGTWQDRQFRDFPSFITPGDCLVLNDSRVFPSRLYGRRENGTGRVEIFLTEQLSNDGLTWTALVRPGRKMRTGERIVISDELSAEILGRGEFGERTIHLKSSPAANSAGGIFDVLERAGHVPLPPYIRRPDTPADRDRYQTVFAQERGSVAAPTAGLHFTPQILDACRAAGAGIAHVTLHVGLGTFQPLHTDVIEDAHLHSERFIVPDAAVDAMDAAKRVIAVGTLASGQLKAQRSGPGIMVSAVERVQQIRTRYDPRAARPTCSSLPAFGSAAPERCDKFSFAPFEPSGRRSALSPAANSRSKHTGTPWIRSIVSFPTGIAC